MFVLPPLLFQRFVYEPRLLRDVSPRSRASIRASIGDSIRDPIWDSAFPLSLPRDLRAILVALQRSNIDYRNGSLTADPGDLRDAGVLYYDEAMLCWRDFPVSLFSSQGQLVILGRAVDLARLFRGEGRGNSMLLGVHHLSSDLLNLYQLAGNDPGNREDPYGLLTTGKGCPGAEQLSAACKKAAGEVTNVRYRRCIKGLCDNGCVKCDDGECCNKESLYGYYNGSERPRCIHLCEKNRAAAGTYTQGQVLAHEFAHQCGWHHEEGPSDHWGIPYYPDPRSTEQ